MTDREPTPEDLEKAREILKNLPYLPTPCPTCCGMEPLERAEAESRALDQTNARTLALALSGARRGAEVERDQALADAREWKAGRASLKSALAAAQQRVADARREAEKERDEARQASREYVSQTDPLLSCGYWEADKGTPGEPCKTCRMCALEAVADARRERDEDWKRAAGQISREPPRTVPHGPADLIPWVGMLVADARREENEAIQDVIWDVAAVGRGRGSCFKPDIEATRKAWVEAIRARLSAPPEPPDGVIPLDETFPKRKAEMIESIRRSERLSGQDMATRIGAPPEKPHVCTYECANTDCEHVVGPAPPEPRSSKAETPRCENGADGCTRIGIHKDCVVPAPPSRQSCEHQPPDYGPCLACQAKRTVPAPPSRPACGHPIVAVFDGTCADCGKILTAGEPMSPSRPAEPGALGFARTLHAALEPSRPAEPECCHYTSAEEPSRPPAQPEEK